MEIPVYLVENWKSKPYLDYFIEVNEWMIFINSKRDFRRIKEIMKIAKKRIQIDVKYDTGKVPTIKFKLINYKDLEIKEI